MLEGLDFAVEALDGVALVGAVAQTCCCHSLSNSSLCYKFFLFLFLIGDHHPVDHTAEGDGDVCSLIVGPFVEVGLIFLRLVMLPAVVEHGVKSRVAWCPFCLVAGFRRN